jgi:hypothetical protein
MNTSSILNFLRFFIYIQKKVDYRLDVSYNVKSKKQS